MYKESLFVRKSWKGKKAFLSNLIWLMRWNQYSAILQHKICVVRSLLAELWLKFAISDSSRNLQSFSYSSRNCVWSSHWGMSVDIPRLSLVLQRWNMSKVLTSDLAQASYSLELVLVLLIMLLHQQLLVHFWLNELGLLDSRWPTILEESQILDFFAIFFLNLFEDFCSFWI